MKQGYNTDWEGDRAYRVTDNSAYNARWIDVNILQSLSVRLMMHKAVYKSYAEMEQRELDFEHLRQHHLFDLGGRKPGHAGIVKAVRQEMEDIIRAILREQGLATDSPFF